MYFNTIRGEPNKWHECACGDHLHTPTYSSIVLITPKDLPTVKAIKWYTNTSGYAMESHGNLLIHREIMKPKSPLVVDHINGNKSDNRRGNLRICTVAQNTVNQSRVRTFSGYKGVSWHDRDGLWYARLSFNGKNIHLGFFTCPIRAAKAYDVAAAKYFGEFARTNESFGLL
jgi:hypothetical protein